MAITRIASFSDFLALLGETNTPHRADPERQIAEIAASPGVEILPYGDLAFGSTPGMYAFSKITVTRNLYRIPLR